MNQDNHDDLDIAVSVIMDFPSSAMQAAHCLPVYPNDGGPLALVMSVESDLDLLQSIVNGYCTDPWIVNLVKNKSSFLTLQKKNYERLAIDPLCR